MPKTNYIGKISKYDIYYNSLCKKGEILFGRKESSKILFIIGGSKDLEVYKNYLIEVNIINKRIKLSSNGNK